MRLIEEIVKNSFLVIASLNPYLVYFVVGLLSFLECAAFLGLFVPGETFVVLAGILASKHIIEIRILLLVVLICAFLGDVVGFLIGRKYGFSFLEKFKRNRFLPSSYIEKTKEFFDRYGAKTMVIARFVGFLRAAAPFLSG
ncbi:MAG: DedA family protein, partial [Actinobacteria bacterium]|nr:DedA family protein [Actinomycetota bacterium]